jgi:MraZ protein
MFLGQHLHSLDAKGRLILPARFREQLSLACITSQIDGCLAVWPGAEFEAIAQRMREKFDGELADRDTARVFFSGAEMATPDAQGRIAIPAHLRSFAHLDKDVVVTGAFDHVEIWDVGVWEIRKQAGEAALAGGGAGPTTSHEER